MKSLKFELFITYQNKQLVFEVEDEPIVIGASDNSHIKVLDSKPPVKVIFTKEDNFLKIKVFDTNYPIKINGKKYKAAKLKDSVFFKIGTMDVIFSSEEVSVPDISLPSIDLEVEEEFDQTRVGELELPREFPEDIPKQVEASSESLIEESTEKVKAVVKQEIPLHLDINDIISFDTVFDEADFVPMTEEAYSLDEKDFSSFIDPEDETETKLPFTDLYKEKKGYSIHVIQMNNGTVIGEKFFHNKFKRLFVSEDFGKKNYFQSFGTGFQKEELAFIKGNHVSVVRLSGFKMSKATHDQVFEVEDRTTQIVPGEKIILTKETNQLIIQLAKPVPKVKINNYFDFDEDLLKNVAYAWVLAAFVLVNVLIADKHKEEPKKQVVIYKIEKKIQKPEDEVTVPQSNPVEPEMKLEEPVEKVADQRKNEEVKVVEKPTPEVKPVEKKVEVAQKAAPPKKTKVVKPRPEVKKESVREPKKIAVAKEAPAPPKKTYKFNFASQMASNLSVKDSAKLKTSKAGGKVDVSAAMDSATDVSSGISESKIGVSETKVSRFTASKAAGSNSMMGTKGLSGKTESNTAYMEAKTKVLGSIDPNLVRKIMREHISQFRYCYQQELIRNPSTAGVFDLGFQIDASGKGVKSFVKSKGKGFTKDGLECIKRVVSGIKFPRPKGGGYVDVRQPMNFYTN